MVTHLPAHARRRALLAGACTTLTALVATLGPSVASAEPFTHNAPSARAALLDACPLDGPSTFENSWGWARSGGRSHEGVDMIAERGTPVVAVRDGDVQFKTNRLGGRAIWLTTPEGDRFYYAHLDDWAGESRSVSAGELIGYVGSTGNAGGPHLHFETLPGAVVENPFPHTLGACVPPTTEPDDIDRGIDGDNDLATGTRLAETPEWARLIPRL